MRISDWSSDVCSSDLPDSRFNNDMAMINANFTIGTDIFKVIAEMDPESCVRYDMIEQVDRFDAHMENTVGVQSILSLPWAAKQVSSAFSEAARSEEHTSELQSLMRISYADSCMKENK